MGGREEYAALGGSDGGRAPPRDLDFRAFQPRACDIAERSGISFEKESESGINGKIYEYSLFVVCLFLISRGVGPFQKGNTSILIA